MRPVAFGRPGTEVIPTGWSAAHRPTTEGTHTSVCTIRHPGRTVGAFDPATGTYPGLARAGHYTGPCRVQRLPALEQTPEVADEQVPTVGYIVAVAWDAAPGVAVGDVVTITSPGPNGDPTLAGVDLVVGSFARGSLSWERVLRCTENQS